MIFLSFILLLPKKLILSIKGNSSTKISIIWLSNETFTFLKKLVEYSSLIISFKSSLLISSLILTLENKIIVESEILLFEALKREGILVPRYFFVEVSINGKNIGLMALEEHFSKE